MLNEHSVENFNSVQRSVNSLSPATGQVIYSLEEFLTAEGYSWFWPVIVWISF